MENDHYVTREEYAELLALARGRKAGLWEMIVNTILWMSAGGAIAFAVLVFMPVGGDAPPAIAPTSGARTSSIRSGGGGGVDTPAITYGGGELPPCSAVTDTTTACQMDEQAPVIVQEEPTPAQPTAPPAYESACWSVPGERPCWLPPDQAWEAPQEIPETPLVLLPPAPLVFSDSACEAWHPPLAWPEGCGDE